jgi:hypothetical protein
MHPRRHVTEGVRGVRGGVAASGRTRSGQHRGARPAKAHSRDGFAYIDSEPQRQRIEGVGWESSCEHDDDTGTCTVLDPFNGAGTTGLVALRHGRSYVGIELNSEYAEMARWRLRDDAPLLNTNLEIAA